MRWRKKTKRISKDILLSLTQVGAYLISVVPLRFFYLAKRTLPENIHSLERGSLLISNHRSKIDPFVVLAYLPFPVFLKLLPIRFPTDNDFMEKKWLRPALRLLGSYDIGATPREKMLGLLRTKELLDERTTVFLFPEGKICRNQMGEFKRGIEFFVGPGRKVVVVQIDGLERSFRALFRMSNSLRFGEVLELRGGEKITASKMRSLFDVT